MDPILRDNWMTCHCITKQSMYLLFAICALTCVDSMSIDNNVIPWYWPFKWQIVLPVSPYNTFQSRTKVMLEMYVSNWIKSNLLHHQPIWNMWEHRLQVSVKLCTTNTKGIKKWSARLTQKDISATPLPAKLRTICTLWRCPNTVCFPIVHIHSPSVTMLIRKLQFSKEHFFHEIGKFGQPTAPWAWALHD